MLRMTIAILLKVLPPSTIGINLTSQFLGYHARNITFVPEHPKQIAFTINLDDIHKPNIRITVIFGSTQLETGWVGEDLYVINADSKESFTVYPLEIVGADYPWVRSMNVFLPGYQNFNEIAFDIRIS